MDKYYTKPEIVKLCLSLLPDSHDYFFLEPSAGNGEFLKELPKPRMGLDILPEHPEVIEQDFLSFGTNKQKIAVVGNPPFGRNASLAIQFFNHAASFADMIAFIVPASFNKTSVINRLDLNWELVLSHKLPTNAFYLPDSLQDFHANCVWQVWKKTDTPRKKVKLPTTHPDLRFVPKEEANIAIRRVGALAGKVFRDTGSYSESSNYFISCAEEVVIKLESLFSKFQEAASNTVGNPSLSKSELVQIYTTS